MNSKYKYDEMDLKEKVKQSINMRHLLSLYGIVPAGGNYGTMKRQLKHFNVDTSHWGTSKERMGHLKGKTHNWSPRMPLSQILIKDTEWGGGSHRIKNRLLEENIFERKCYNCNLTTWMKDSIPLELEHINGDRMDYRKENLTLLCPNCHAQTKTYRGKNKGSNGASGGT